MTTVERAHVPGDRIPKGDSNQMNAHISQSRMTRIGLIGLFAIAAFFASYRLAVALTGPSAAPATASAPAASASGAAPAQAAPAGSGGCACCGGAQAPAGAATAGAATVEGGVQRISVDLSKGYYDPSTIQLKAGIPAEITFSQSSGCTAQVQSPDLGFFEDLSSGPKTVKLPALQAGSYGFACGMNMVSGTIVVK